MLASLLWGKSGRRPSGRGRLSLWEARALGVSVEAAEDGEEGALFGFGFPFPGDLLCRDCIRSVLKSCRNVR